jgi:molecular chaperone HtpG
VDSDLKESMIYKELERRSGEATILRGNVDDIIRDASVMLGRVSDTFAQYTLHDKTHSMSVLRIMDQIIPEETMRYMNELELALLILSAFLHDIGLVVPKRERDEIPRSSDFISFQTKYPRIKDSLDKAREKGDQRVATEIEEQLLTYYLREQHGVRGAKFIKSKFKDKLEYSGIDFSDILCKICQSHCERWEKLGVRAEESHGYPLKDEYPTSYSIASLKVNVQYLAIALRLADALNFDRERTPPVLFEYLYPVSEISLVHWLAHLSVQGWSIEQDRIKYRVECEHPLYQKTVNDFLDAIDDELQGARLLVEKFPAKVADRYKLNLPTAVDRSEIGPKIVDGKPFYVYCDFQFSLDYDKVLTLLSEEIAYDPTASIRELLQNAVDACAYRAAVEKALGMKWGRQKARIRLKYLSDARKLTIEDNGIGMDQSIVQQHLLKIGSSYFSRDNPRFLQDIALFKNKGIDFYPISKFGIGIISCFLIADQLEVKTRRKEYGKLCPPLIVRIDPRLKLYVV